MAAGVNAPLYTTEILRLAASLKLEASLAAPSGRAETRSPTCGSVISTDVALDDGGRVTGLTQQVQACAFGQASAALMQDFAIGRSVKELTGARAELASWLKNERDDNTIFAALAPARNKTARHGAILLPLDALLAAIADARK